jgi:hypothetical protein
MTLENPPLANRLRGEVGWNQTMEDWKRFLEMEPEGCFVAQWLARLSGLDHEPKNLCGVSC